MLNKSKPNSTKPNRSGAPVDGLDAFVAAWPRTFPDPNAERLQAAVILMSKMLDDRPYGVELDFRRIQFAASAFALSATAPPAT
jgi:hypothetical protein